jgi:hypothetical protein
LEDLDVDGNIVLKWSFKKWDWGMDWIYRADDKGQVAGCCECGSIKCGELFD